MAAMISFDEAIDLIRSVARPIGTERVPIARAAGRVLAADVAARLASPADNVSAMDGYAVRDEDLAAFPVQLRLIGESFAGLCSEATVGPGECVRIFTGGPVPAGADRVVLQEDVEQEGDVALISAHPGPARHIRLRGSDFREGDVLLRAGRLLDPRGVVAAAAADRPEVEVFRRPRLFILGTGDELAEPGTAAETPGAIPESVSFGVAALAEQWGAEMVGRRRLRDELASMEAAAAEAVEQADVVVVTGGASVGAKDFARGMFEPLGLELVYSKVAIKPGKPAWLGHAGGRLVIGLPGNPTSALVTGRLFLAPLLAGMAGRGPDAALRWRSARLAGDLGACGARETFHRGRLAGAGVEILPNQDSSAQRTLAEADVLVRQRANAPAQPAQDPVELLDF